ncbi:MAG: Crp/Fnr family transcriptional regulator, partial [Acidimicrobiales bacterium]
MLRASFLGRLPESVQSEVLEATIVVELPSGQLVYDPQLAIVATGALRVFLANPSGRQIAVSYLRCPVSVGLARLAGQAYPVAFQAVGVTRLLRVGRQRFEGLRHEHPELGWAATEEVTRRLNDVLAETALVAFGSLRQRVAHHLLA